MKRLLIFMLAVIPLAALAAVAQGHATSVRAAAAPPKLTVCHKTGADTWQRITISGRALANPNSQSGMLLRGHMRHTGDAVVVGTAACPPVSSTPETGGPAPTKVTICHKTGSTKNPYRRITVSSNAVANPNSQSGNVLRGHAQHVGDLLMPGVTPCPSVSSS